MKTSFEFHDYNVPVTIAGLDFTIDCSADTGEYLSSVGKRLYEFAEEVKNGDATLEDVFSYGRGVVDYLLGAGAAKKIFKGRPARISDMADLCVFLMQVVSTYQKEHRLVLK